MLLISDNHDKFFGAFVAGTYRDHFSYAKHASQINLCYGKATDVLINYIYNTNTNVIHMKMDITPEHMRSCTSVSADM